MEKKPGKFVYLFSPNFIDTMDDSVEWQQMDFTHVRHYGDAMKQAAEEEAARLQVRSSEIYWVGIGWVNYRQNSAEQI